MSRISLTVNGDAVTAEVAPRIHLADFLREDRLLTGTHLGCEHGVCGACTLLIDGAPARSCIAFAVACDGAEVRTIEGLDDDPLIVRLRAAFTAEHALQCGYCTPGMLVTARDIVQRLPDADEARIRLELAGNLCRCTGYAGIVRAIRRVLGEGVAVAEPEPARLPDLPPRPRAETLLAASAAAATFTPDFVQTVRIGQPIAAVWSAVGDIQGIVACVPGARLIELSGNRMRGEIRASLGPIEALFVGEGSVTFDAARRQAGITGTGRDGRTGTHLSAQVVARLCEANSASTDLLIEAAYALRGPLAQFARGRVIEEFAGAIMASFVANLEARLAGAPAPEYASLRAGTLLWRLLWRRLLALLRIG